MPYEMAGENNARGKYFVRQIYHQLLLTMAFVLASSPIAAADDSVEPGGINTDCVIEPNKLVDISSAVSGVMDRLAVKRGDTVKKGQILATLDSRVEKASVELARAHAERDQLIKASRARSDFTKRRLARNKELYRKNMVSAQVVDETETEAILADLELGEALEERRIAELELKRAEESLQTRTIRSPFDGVVVDVDVVPGESVEDKPLLRIARIDPLNVEVIAPVQMLGKITKGMTATVIPEQPIGGEYTAEVVIVDQVVDAASGTFGIRLELPNPRNRLPAGLRCQISFRE